MIFFDLQRIGTPAKNIKDDVQEILNNLEYIGG